MNLEWIDTTDALKDLCTHLRAQPWVAVDTEFHRERTYYAQLALVQLASLERVACVDPIADIDLAPLDELMADPEVLKVMHAGRQDLEIFFDRTGAVPGPLFDTQVAASLLGRGDQLGYAALVAQTEGTQLKKLHGRTDWMRRPLDKAVIEYAADDVRYLRDVYLQLDEELRSKERRGWLDEEQAYLLEVETYAIPLGEAWKRLKGAGRLKAPERAVARAIAGWREKRAREVDRPRRRVLSDDAILDLARIKPKDVGGLERMRSIDAGMRKRHGKRLVQLIAEGLAVPEGERPAGLDKGPPGVVDAALVDALSAVLQVRAREADISPRALASRSDLERIAAGEREGAVLRGWRKNLAGDALLSLLDGALSLAVRDGELVVSAAGPSSP